MKDNAAITEKLLYQGPLLSDAMGEFLTAKKTQLPEGSREISYFEHRTRAFLEIVGDKRIGEYTEGDLTYFAGELRFLPERHTVHPLWKGKTLVAALEENRSRSPGSRARSLSFTTIKIGYIGKIKTCIRWLCANYRVQYPFDYGHTLIPKDARSPTIRLSLDSSHLNELFTACTKDADAKRPENVWLPLLAYLTGARLGELVGLQPHNIKQYENIDIADLTTQISDARGIRNRPIKTHDSLRIFALHPQLRKLGFIDWVEGQRALGYEYLFPDLHVSPRPTHVASKRFQRLFASVGMGGPFVFHSLRHSFKDWARSQGVPERTIALQAGHSLDGIALRYGAKILRPDELQQLASFPLPSAVAFDVFRNVRPVSVVPPSSTLLPNKRSLELLPSSGLEKPKAKNKKLLPGARAQIHDEAIDVRTLRSNLRMSQREFCSVFDISLGALRDWEQGRTKPGRAARALLSSIALGQRQVQIADGSPGISEVEAEA